MGQASSSKRVTAQDRAILDLKIQRDKLRQYRARIDALLKAEHDAAAAALRAGNKPLALLCLRRQKYQSTLLMQTDQQLATLQELTSSIEFALVQQDVVFGLKRGNEVLQQIRKEMTLENVERLVEDTAEGIRYQKEVSEMLTGAMSNQDEDEVEDELERMEREVTGAVLPNVPDAVIGERDKAKQRARARKEELERSAAAESREEPMLA